MRKPDRAFEMAFLMRRGGISSRPVLAGVSWRLFKQLDRVGQTDHPRYGREWRPYRGWARFLEQFRNYCGLKKIARSGFPWEKTTKRPVAPRISCGAALAENNYVRLSSRKVACSSAVPPTSTGNPGSVYTIAKLLEATARKIEKGIRESKVTQLNRNPFRPVSWSKVSQVNFGLLSK